MKTLALAALILAVAPFSHAQVYNCHAKANIQRGFNADFDIQVTSLAKGGRIVISSWPNQPVLGTISETAVIDRNNPAFQLTIGLIGEADLSGLKNSDLNKVTSIASFKATAPAGETTVFQIFNGAAQIGGTLLWFGLGTSCLPTNQ